MEKVLLTEVMVEAFKLLVTERHERSYWKNSISISFLVDVDWRDSGCMNKTGDFVFKNSSTKNYVIYTVIEQINFFGNINFWKWVYAIIDSEDANCGYYKVQKFLKKEQHRWLSINQPFKKNWLTTSWKHSGPKTQKRWKIWFFNGRSFNDNGTFDISGKARVWLQDQWQKLFK